MQRIGASASSNEHYINSATGIIDTGYNRSRGEAFAAGAV
jgi:hypothetical protein